jgi:TRAP-type mannitol/chloroaromatic compound transport system permease small subunit
VTIERFGDSHLNVNVIRDRLSDPVYLTIFLSGTSLIFSPFATVKIYKAYDLLNQMKKRSE